MALSLLLLLLGAGCASNRSVVVTWPAAPWEGPARHRTLGAMRAGHYHGASRDGAYDLAGNVREWTRDAMGDNRFSLGGSWSDPGYAFNDAVAFDAFDRSPSNGIRLVQYPDTTNLALASVPITPAFRDYPAERPSNDVFAVYRQLVVFSGTGYPGRSTYH